MAQCPSCASDQAPLVDVEQQGVCAGCFKRLQVESSTYRGLTRAQALGKRLGRRRRQRARRARDLERSA